MPDCEDCESEPCECQPRAILAEKTDYMDTDADITNPRHGADRWERYHLEWLKKQKGKKNGMGERDSSSK